MTTDFSVTDCGPMDRIVARTGPRRLILRAVLLALVAWVPLLVLTLMSGDSHPPGTISFLHDLSAHVRFLVVIPLLILAEAPIGDRTRRVAANFLDSGLVAEGDRPRFLEAVRRSHRLLDSTLVEVALLAVSVGAMIASFRELSADGQVFWFEDGAAGGRRLTLAGRWYAVASPVVAFLFLRWAWRYAMWCGFLRRISRLSLRIAGTHPDGAGGLAFVGIGQQSFALISLAGSLVVASAAATEILFAGVSLLTYKYALGAFVVVSVLVALAPSPIFAAPLARAKREGFFRYGKISTRYVQAFEGKWLGDGAPSDDRLLGSGDIQSLADLGASYERLETMRTSPFDKRTVIAFAIAAAGPMLPLALTVMPLREIVKVLVKAMV